MAQVRGDLEYGGAFILCIVVAIERGMVSARLYKRRVLYFEDWTHIDHSAPMTVSRVGMLREGDPFKSLD